MTKTDIEKILFLDIETVPLVYNYSELNESARDLWDKKWQYNKEVPPEQQYAKAGIYAEFARVVCIGLGFYNNKKFRVKTIASENEMEILTQFADLLKQHFNSSSHLLCAHNGKEFDFPFLCRRFLINNLPLPKTLQLQGLKPWNVNHIDTMDLWKFGDLKNFSSLNLLAHVLGIPSPKDDMDGSQVAKTYYEDKDLSKIEKYCMKDVITLARVYNRFIGSGNLNDDDIIFA
ncbi:3'-5' exonuclease [Aurantibacillus circumpalustris]|uniref:3'-5' exonuclease n=1 Tax=Aurantibacillus circumpalustris TaxID=3036359 RepID=UPI00295BBE09|nr:3'-5' exonuclease [Aurantibacillus circumpalustris]